MWTRQSGLAGWEGWKPGRRKGTRKLSKDRPRWPLRQGGHAADKESGRGGTAAGGGNADKSRAILVVVIWTPVMAGQ